MFPSDHPLTPPLTTEDRTQWLRLLRSRRVGPATFLRLMAEHGTAEAALDALPGIAAAAGVDGYAVCPEGVARAEIAAAERAGATMLTWGMETYPARLAQTCDAPPVLWAVGRVEMLSRPTVAIVGARNASSLGMRMAGRLAEALGAAGYVVVSGLARGVDQAAHVRSVGTGTVAVLAGGVDVPYPAENAALMQEIGEAGCLISEQPFHVTPQARHFPRRNRIISGLAEAVVVVEAAAKSGSLSTARTALDQGREVLAVPGHPFDARAAGCNMLIRDGAILVRDARDVIEALAPPADPARAARPAEASPEMRSPSGAPGPKPRSLAETAALHSRILERLGPAPLAEDQLIRDLAEAPAAVAPELVALEIEGRIERQPGGLLARVA